MAKKAKTSDVTRILRLLRKQYPDAECALNYETPVQLLVATILSAQCTDERVNIVTAELFRRYPLRHRRSAARSYRLLPATV